MLQKYVFLQRYNILNDGKIESIKTTRSKGGQMSGETNGDRGLDEGVLINIGRNKKDAKM